MLVAHVLLALLIPRTLLRAMHHIHYAYQVITVTLMLHLLALCQWKIFKLAELQRAHLVVLAHMSLTPLVHHALHAQFENIAVTALQQHFPVQLAIVICYVHRVVLVSTATLVQP